MVSQIYNFLCYDHRDQNGPVTIYLIDQDLFRKITEPLLYFSSVDINRVPLRRFQKDGSPVGRV